ncbi:hypothetical protein F4778DRAFT_429149 [Xylariomycetidae sp. FL2044]|nr:hypothetical protein F4778DRAFT_429149 [Xylariomycetidae sp. FL2044]
MADNSGDSRATALQKKSSDPQSGENKNKASFGLSLKAVKLNIGVFFFFFLGICTPDPKPWHEGIYPNPSRHQSLIQSCPQPDIWRTPWLVIRPQGFRGYTKSGRLRPLRSVSAFLPFPLPPSMKHTHYSQARSTKILRYPSYIADYPERTNLVAPRSRPTMRKIIKDTIPGEKPSASPTVTSPKKNNVQPAPKPAPKRPQSDWIERDRELGQAVLREEDGRNRVSLSADASLCINVCMG